MITDLVKVPGDYIPAPLSTIITALNWIVCLFCRSRIEREEAKEWIQFCGSEKLKLAVKLGILKPMMKSYVQERELLEWSEACDYFWGRKHLKRQ